MDALERLLAHARTRRRMTKAELLFDARLGDEAWLNAASERDMAEVYYKALERHLQKTHKCAHDLVRVAEE